MTQHHEKGAFVGRMTIGEPVASPTLADRIEQWADEFIRPEVDANGVPYEAALGQLESGLAAIGEFAVEPLKATLRRIVTQTAETFDADPRPEPGVSWADVGRLMHHVDTMRDEISQLLGDIHEVGLLVRDQLPNVAGGYFPETERMAPPESAYWRRFYGLTTDNLDREDRSAGPLS